MHARRTKVAGIILSAAVLSQASAYGAYAASTTTSSTKTATTTTVSTLDKLGSIALKSNVSVKLSDVGFLTQDGGNILTYTLSYYNGSGSSINLVDYFSKVTTAGGSVIQGVSIAWDMVLISFVFSLLIGVIFGMMPANKAARLRPIHALRNE